MRLGVSRGERLPLPELPNAAIVQVILITERIDSATAIAGLAVRADPEG